MDEVDKEVQKLNGTGGAAALSNRKSPFALHYNQNTPNRNYHDSGSSGLKPQNINLLAPSIFCKS